MPSEFSDIFDQEDNNNFKYILFKIKSIEYGCLLRIWYGEKDFNNDYW